MRTHLRRLAADTGYLMLGFPLATVAFCLMVAGLSAEPGPSSSVSGWPSSPSPCSSPACSATSNGRRIALVLDRPVPRPHYPAPPPGAGIGSAGWSTPIVTPQSWLDALLLFIMFPVAIATFVVTVVMWALVLSGVTYPIYGWFTSRIPGNDDLPELLGLPGDYLSGILFHAVLGLLAMLVIFPVVRFMATLQANLSRTMLSGMAELQGRIDHLTEGRARRRPRRGRRAAAARTGHPRRSAAAARPPGDGAVAGPAAAGARRRGRVDDDRAGDHRHPRDARRAAGPVAGDRPADPGRPGLNPALSALAARCTVPVELDVRIEERYAALVENTVYFVTAEALTNVAKHSRATLCRVMLERMGDSLLLTIGDDGVGGAHVAKGHGLSGLADRLRAVDGELSVQSPTGGPTLIVAEVPCG